MKYKYLTSVIIIIFVLGVSITSIIKPDLDISKQEGRKLQVLPLAETFEEGTYKEELANGEAFKKWDNYFSDHIVGRGTIVNAYTDMQLLIGKEYINKLYLGKDDELLEVYSYKNYDANYIKERGQYFNDFATKFDDSKTYIIDLANKEYAYEHKMPIENYMSGLSVYIPKLYEEIDKDQITAIETIDEVRKGDDNYYKTDHHMNMNGVYKVYNYIINNLRKDFEEIPKPKEKSDFSIVTYEDVFIGAQGRVAPSVVEEMDDIQVYHDNNIKDYKVYNQNGKSKFYHKELISKDRLNGDYGVYLGGDNPIVKVENNESLNNLKVVAIGDSMDNPLIPLLSYHFNETYSYDLRHYEGDVIKDIDAINPDIILLMGQSSNYLVQTEIFNWEIK